MKRWFLGLSVVAFCAVGCSSSSTPADPPAADSAASDSQSPPAFAGIATVAAQGDQAVVLTWVAATDNDTPANQIVYNIYYATSAGDVFSSTPIVTLPGATTITISDVFAAQSLFYGVRAVDQGGNTDTNTATKQAAQPEPPDVGVEDVPSVPSDSGPETAADVGVDSTVASDTASDTTATNDAKADTAPAVDTGVTLPPGCSSAIDTFEKFSSTLYGCASGPKRLPITWAAFTTEAKSFCNAADGFVPCTLEEWAKGARVPKGNYWVTNALYGYSIGGTGTPNCGVASTTVNSLTPYTKAPTGQSFMVCSGSTTNSFCAPLKGCAHAPQPKGIATSTTAYLGGPNYDVSTKRHGVAGVLCCYAK